MPIYLPIRSKDEPIKFMHYMEFEDSGAEEQHKNSAAVKKVVDILYSINIAGAEIYDRKLIASCLHDNKRKEAA